jgi:hypothetical protein
MEEGQHPHMRQGRVLVCFPCPLPTEVSGHNAQGWAVDELRRHENRVGFPAPWFPCQKVIAPHHFRNGTDLIGRCLEHFTFRQKSPFLLGLLLED